MKWDTVAIVGVGLIGGSIGLALRKRRLAKHVVGIGRDAHRLEEARHRGAVTSVTTDLAQGVADAELTIVCTPVQQIAQYVRDAAEHVPPGALLTDAGSTKGQIVAALEGPLPQGAVFIGSHPLAGSEKQGVAHAKADLFEKAVCILTPTRRSPQSAVARLKRFWHDLGARVKIMSPDAHDRALAQTSHLPHLLAAALAGIVPEKLRELAATGLRDTTRIAAGDPQLWSGIFLQNRFATLEALDRLQRRLMDYQRALQQSDTKRIQKLLLQAKRKRDALGS